MEVIGGFREVVGGLITIGILLSVYFLPTLIRSGKKRKNTGAVFALSLLLGWTVLG